MTSRKKNISKPERAGAVVDRGDGVSPRAAPGIINGDTEEISRALIETNCQGIMVAAGMPPHLRYCNSVMADWLGYSVAELLAMSPEQTLTLIHPDDRKMFLERYRLRLTTDEPARIIEFRVIGRDGALRWLYVTATRIRFGGDPAMLGMYFDITERKLVEKERDAAAMRSRRLVQSTLDGYILADTEGVIRDVNPAYCAISGYGRDEIVGTNIRDLEARMNDAEVAERIERVRTDGNARFFTKHRRKNGSTVDLDVSITVISDEDHDLIAAFVRDVSAQKRIEEQYRESAAYYRSAFEESPVALWEEDFSAVREFVDARREEGVGDFSEYFCEHPEVVRECADLVRVVDVNEACVKLYAAKTRDDLLAGLGKVMTDDAIDVFCNELVALIEKRSSFEARARQRRLDGRVFNATVNISIATGFEQSWARVFVSVIDTTRIEQAITALAESQRRVDRILRTAPVGLGVTVDRKIKFVNRKLCNIFRYEADELTGRDVCILYENDKDYERVGHSEAEQLAIRGASTHDARCVRKDGKIIDVLIHSVFLNSSDPSEGILSSVVDVTERRELEAQLLQSQKMEAVGRLAGGVAHDLNNLLTVINGFSELAMSSADPNDPATADIEQILDAGRRAETLTRQLLAFSRKQVLRPELFDVNRMLEELDGMVRRLIGEDIEFALDTGEVGNVLADRSQLEQVMLNMFINARDAMATGGQLTVRTSVVDVDAAYVASHPESREGSYVMISVSDTGGGMVPEVRAHIFEPFFTTKEMGRGTGLGLSTAYGIVHQSGGHIGVYTEPGRGTTFRIYLPVCRTDRARKEAERTLSGSVPGAGRILVVEDEETVRSFVCRALKRSGYTVLAAGSAPEALELLGSSDIRVDLVLTDVVMPRMSGHVLADRLARDGLDVPVVYMTGYSEETASDHGVAGRGVRVLRKPFTVRELTECVRTEMARTAG